MPDLVAIAGGAEEPDGSCCTPQMEEGVEALFYAMPARTRQEMVGPMAERLGRDVNVQYVAVCLTHVREYAQHHGWTVPHARRGRPTTEQRFHPVLVDNSEESYWEPGTESQVWSGAMSTLKLQATEARHQERALLVAADYLPHPTAQRAVKRLARRHAVIAAEASELAEDLAQFRQASNGD